MNPITPPPWKRCPTRWLFAALLAFLIGACAAPPAVAPDRQAAAGGAVVPAGSTLWFKEPPADALMINEGVSRLGLADKPADYAGAREIFAALTTMHPESRWRPLAETFLRLLDALASLQAKSRSVQTLADTLQQDNDRLKKEMEALAGRYQGERAMLVQQNEQLRKDMELLKKLEVQLDQREKMLR